MTTQGLRLAVQYFHWFEANIIVGLAYLLTWLDGSIEVVGYEDAHTVI